MDYHLLPASAPPEPINPAFQAMQNRITELEQKLKAFQDNRDLETCLKREDWETVIRLLPSIQKWSKSNLQQIFQIEVDQTITKGNVSSGRLKLWKAVLKATKMTGDELHQVKLLKADKTESQSISCLHLLIMKGDLEIMNWVRLHTHLDNTFSDLMAYEFKGYDIVTWAIYHTNILALENLRQLRYPTTQACVFPVILGSSWDWPNVLRKLKAMGDLSPSLPKFLVYWAEKIAPHLLAK